MIKWDKVWRSQEDNWIGESKAKQIGIHMIMEY